MRQADMGSGIEASLSTGPVSVPCIAFPAAALTHFPHPLKFHEDRSKQ
jgi:hypothetical protein